MHSEQIDKEAGQPEQLRWSPDGTLLSVSTKHGTLLGMAVLSSDSDVLGAFKDAHVCHASIVYLDMYVVGALVTRWDSIHQAWHPFRHGSVEQR